MNIHRSAALSGGTSGKSLRSKQRSPRSLIDGAIALGAGRTHLLRAALKTRGLLANTLSVDGNPTTRVDVDASTLAKF